MAVSQANTYRTTTKRIMLDPAFAREFDDARAGRAFDWTIDDWNYERGRLFAHIAPIDMRLRTGSALNQKARALLDVAFHRRLIT